MNERGVFNVDRGVWDHPMFAPEPYTEREAWLWMLSAAAWEAKRVRVGSAVFDLKRGQLAFATRFLSNKFKWSHSKTVRFLNRLKIGTLVSTLATREATLITICKYDEYQFGRNTDETPTGTPTGTEVKRERYKEEALKQLNNKQVLEGAFAPPAEKQSRKKAARPLPDIFPMTDEHREYAAKHGFLAKRGNGFVGVKDGPAVEMFEAFKNHHVAKGSLMADWNAAWRTWVNNQAKWNAQRGKPAGLSRGRL